jgi:hypothetical protein
MIRPNGRLTCQWEGREHELKDRKSLGTFGAFVERKVTALPGLSRRKSRGRMTD